MRAFLVPLLVLSAGCLTAPEDVETASVEPAVPTDPATGLPLAVAPAFDKNSSVDAPEWRVGDAWTVETHGAGEPERATLVVASASGAMYEMRSTSEQMATFDAVFDVSYLGDVRASDLAGHQQGQPIRFFAFPLEDGKSWTTTWDGQEISLRAGFSPSIPAPGGAKPGFIIQGTTADGQTYVEYDYVPALRWWSHIVFTEGYGFKVTAATANWTGEVLEGTSKVLLTLAPAGPTTSTPGGVFMVEAGQSAVTVIVMGHASAYARGLAIVDPDGTEHAGPVAEESPAPGAVFDLRILPGTAGEWRVLAPTLHAPGGGFVLVAQQVAMTPIAV